MADTPAKPTLLDLAKIRFVDDISPAEKKLSKQRKKVKGLIVEKTLGKGALFAVTGFRGFAQIRMLRRT